MTEDEHITIEELRNYFDYCAETGILRWRHRESAPDHINSRDAGRVAGSPCGKGYINIGINGRLYPAHRVAFAIYHGRWPRGVIDHINREKSDNRIGNIREATHSQNTCNSRVVSKNALGIKGVRKVGNSYNARITVDRKLLDLGCYKDPMSAKAAYDLAAEKYHGEFRPR